MRTSWYHGWNVVAVCVLSQVAALGVATNCFSFFLEPWSRDFGMPMSTLTLSITLFSVSCAVLAPIAGRVCERYSVRCVFVIATLGVVLFHVLIGATAALSATHYDRCPASRSVVMITPAADAVAGNPA